MLNPDSKFSTKAREQSALYRAAQILAHLSRLEEARATLQRAENLSGSEEERQPWDRIAAWALVGDYEKTAELVRAVNAGRWTAYGTCTSEELLPMRSDQRYSDLFQNCPPFAAPGASSNSGKMLRTARDRTLEYGAAHIAFSRRGDRVEP